MPISDQGLDLIARREGKRAQAYLDTANPPVWTIGIGHTGPEVCEGLVWTNEQIMAAFRQDIGWVEDTIDQLVKLDLEQYERDALGSFIFNIGRPQFERSHLLALLNAGHVDEAAAQFDRWHIPPSIITRRNAEREQFKGTAFEPTIA